ncbi:MAG: FAD-binding oxidoreductase [Acidimicrobiales bacterium]
MLTPAPGTPTPPIALAGGAGTAKARLAATRVDVPDDVVERLRRACAEVTADEAACAEASRDWWPLAMCWATEGEVAGLADVVCRPADAAEVAAVLAVCNAAHVPVTPAAGRSGVLGGSVPIHGGVALDLTALSGIVEIDETSMVLDVRAGTFGTPLEEELRSTHGCTIGHWPQSVDLSTVGGWLACRGAGQFSNRYGKIEDMVVGLDVVLADGSQVTTGGAPRQAVGPDLNQLFVGSEGTLGVITSARLRLHGLPAATKSAAYGFTSIGDAFEAQRRIVQRGAGPAVLRLYDAAEAQRSYNTPAGTHLLLAYDEGDAEAVAYSFLVIERECRMAERLPASLVDTWFAKRNDVSALEALISKGFVVDTMEVAGRWRDLPAIYDATLAALSAVPGTLGALAHQSHSYPDGACLYFTFAGLVDPDERTEYHRALWDAGQPAALAAGAALSHHHGVGLARSRFVRDALGPAFEVLARMKKALDPNGILNPGKLGLPSPFGEVGY